MRCKLAGCDGQIDMSSGGISLRTGCVLGSTAYPCSKCKRLYFADGELVFHRAGRAAFSDHSSLRPVALINPFVKGQEGKGYTYYVIYSVADHKYLSTSSKFICKSAGWAWLFDSVEGAVEKAKSLNLEVEVSTEEIL